MYIDDVGLVTQVESFEKLEILNEDLSIIQKYLNHGN